MSSNVPAIPRSFERDINFVSPANAFVLAGDKWEDDDVTDIDYTSSDNAGDSNLDPGEELTAVEAVANEVGTFLALSAVATTEHAADMDADGVDESIIRYKYQMKPTRQADKYNTLPGMSSTLSFGAMGDPQPFVPNAYIGPVKAFRVIFENRADEFSSSESVGVNDIGCHLHGRVLRGVGTGEGHPVSPTEFFDAVHETEEGQRE